ncbi:MAG: glycosyltransferase family 39 protein [Pseudomonadota bacterium]
MRALFNNLDSRRNLHWIAILILIAIIIQRGSTFFVDYYDADVLAAIVQTNEYLAGGIPGGDFLESKLPLYHFFFKVAYLISGEYGWVIVSAIVCAIIALTSYFLYLIGKMLFDKRVGILTALFYGVLTSSFNRHFMAANAEVFFSLPIVISFYFLCCYEFKQKYKILSLILSLFFVATACSIKMHPFILFPFLIFYFVIQKPFTERVVSKKYINLLLIAALLVSAFFILDLLFFKTAIPRIRNVFDDFLLYATTREFSVGKFFLYFVHRVGTLTINHLVLWIPLFAFLIHTPRFIRNRDKKELIVLTFFLFNFIAVFSGGVRFYYHYFIQPFSAICMIAAYQWIRWIDANPNRERVKKTCVFLFMIPVCIYLIWNYYGAYVRNFNPSLFYNEPKIVKYFRLGFVSQTKDYLLPDEKYKDAIDWLNKHKKPGQKLFVWGNTPVLNYFTGLGQGSYSMWHEQDAKSYIDNISSSDSKDELKAKNYLNNLLNNIAAKKADFVVDATRANINEFDRERYGLENFPGLNQHINDSYDSKTSLGDMDVYYNEGPDPF